ncbi:MAG: UDP-glucose 4-epimerase GalE [Clostridia bacterium]|nr:UDP-glucose 4-epimerase GalE [Clostridia bacterium]
MAILVTGGAGYIGSHTCVELLNAGYDVIVMDNYVNSCAEAVRRVEELTGRTVRLYEKDIRDEQAYEEIFTQNNVECVIHFAGLKAVGESVHKPVEYYDNNIGGTVKLLAAMQKYGCKRIVFSSSATVYGSNNPVPFREDMPTGGTTNPYGTTKLFIERILSDTQTAHPDWNVVLLRYFNPIGAHESGRIGEDPQGIPNTLMPYIAQVAVGKLPMLHVFGDDYDTPDGTGVRDYIHVVDLAIGHVKAVTKAMGGAGVFVYNLGTGHGVSVLELVHAFEKASGVKVPYQIDPRRPGDIAVCYADATRAQRELGWVAERGVDEMCADTWRWQSRNPKGYK